MLKLYYLNVFVEEHEYSYKDKSIYQLYLKAFGYDICCEVHFVLKRNVRLKQSWLGLKIIELQVCQEQKYVLVVVPKIVEDCQHQANKDERKQKEIDELDNSRILLESVDILL